MTRQASRSAGLRHPARNATLFGLLTIVGAVLVVLGAADMRRSGRSGSPLLVLGLFPALLSPIAFARCLSAVRIVRDMRSGRTAIARWSVPAEQFSRFVEEDQRLAERKFTTNFYRPPNVVPAAGVEVIFSDDGVLIGDGYFPLSTTRGRRVVSVRYVDGDPPTIEFGTTLNTLVRTSSATVATTRLAETLRVPVATGARREAGDVVRRYEGMISAGLSRGLSRGQSP